MGQKRLLYTLVCFIAIFTIKNSVHAQPNGRTITLNEFIKNYLTNSYELKQAYEQLRLSRGNKLLAESQDDIFLSADAGYNNASGVQLGTAKETMNMMTGSVGLNKKFSGTGTSISATDNFGFGSSTSSKTKSANSLSVSVLQPLLKNFFGFLDRIPIKQAALALKSNEILYQKSIENNIVNAITLYLEWVRYHKEQDILKQIISNNETVFRQTRAQLNAGIAEVSDLEISRFSVIQYQQQLLTNSANLQTTVLSLNDYLPVSDTDKPDMQVVEASLDFPNIATNPNYIRSIRSMNYLLEQAQLGIDSARNQYLPSLDAVASFQFNSGASEFLSGIGGGGTSGKTNFFLGVQFSMPLFLMGARANEIMSIAQYETVLLQRDQAIRDILRMAKSFQHQLAIMNQAVLQQVVLVQSLTRQVNSQNQQYRRGSLALENLITGRNNLSNAMLQENNLKISAYQLYNQYLSIIDRLLDDYKTSVPEDIIISDPEIG